MNLKPRALALLVLLSAVSLPASAAGESPSTPSLIGILYKQFDAIKTLFVEHQARVQAKLDQFEKILAAPSPNAIEGLDIGVSAGNWNGVTPDRLELSHDKDNNTATGWAQTSGGGNMGWINIDLRKSYRGFVEIRLGLKSSTSDRVVSYNIINSDDGVHWITSWTADRWAVADEYVTTLRLPLNGRYFQFQAHDLARGTADVRIYDIRVTEIP